MGADEQRAVMDQFAKNLKYLRKRAGLSQEELCFRASVHRTAVSTWERGLRLPRIDSLVKVCAALGVSANELLDSIDWEPGRSIAGGFKLLDSEEVGQEPGRRRVEGAQ